MRSGRTLLLLVSLVAAALLLGGGVFLSVGADEGAYGQSVLFAEVLSLVMDNYVDPVESDTLLRGAYEGMLAGVDPNSAYLAPDEVVAWKAGRPSGAVGPGLTVLRNGSSLQVVAVAAESPAADAGVEVGDQIRQIDGQEVRDLSLEQARRLLVGAPGSTVALSLLRPREGFERHDVTVDRNARRPRPYSLDVVRGFGVLTVTSLIDLPVDELAGELGDVRDRGVRTILLDLRNVADGSPRDALPLIGLFTDEATLELRDVDDEVVETLDASGTPRAWTGRLALLVNGATADGGEAAAAALADALGATVYGESTYGLGAEPRLFELENGDGLLVSAAAWRTADGAGWNRDGIEPDETVDGEGSTFAEVVEDQRRKVLDLLEQAASAETAETGSRPAA